MQLNLFDHTKLILSKKASVVTFISKDREMITKSLDWYLKNGSLDIIERLKYTQEVLHEIITKKSKKDGAK
jgi:hypothetical protein